MKMGRSFAQNGRNICCSLKHWLQLLEVIRNFFGGCEGGSGSVTLAIYQQQLDVM